MGRYKMKIALTSVVVAVVAGFFLMGAASAEKSKEPVSSYSPVVIKEGFATIMERMKSEKPKVMARQMELLNKRYDLSNRPAKGVTMTRGKTVQEGVRAKLPAGQTWEKLAAISRKTSKKRGCGPRGSCRCLIPITPRGGCSFPSITSKRLTSRRAGT